MHDNQIDFYFRIKNLAEAQQDYKIQEFSYALKIIKTQL